jgi:uncharacterized paraquat-inducible protein A
MSYRLKRFQFNVGEETKKLMEVIVCQSCDAIVDYMETEKAGVLYGTCPGCQEKSSREERR